MKDVFEAVHPHDPARVVELMGLLTEAQRAEQLSVAELVERTRRLAKQEYAQLPRDTRRRLVRDAVVRVKRAAGLLPT